MTNQFYHRFVLEQCSDCKNLGLPVRAHPTRCKNGSPLSLAPALNLHINMSKEKRKKERGLGVRLLPPKLRAAARAALWASLWRAQIRGTFELALTCGRSRSYDQERAALR